MDDRDLSESPPATPAEVLPRGTVMVVDDAVSVGKITVACLTSAGFRTHTASNGEEAIGLLWSGLEFDALVTDYAMIGMSGTDLALRARELYPTLPVLVITGYVGAEGLDDLPPDVAILRKPFPRIELVRAVTTLIEHVNSPLLGARPVRSTSR